MGLVVLLVVNRRRPCHEYVRPASCLLESPVGNSGVATSEVGVCHVLRTASASDRLFHSNTVVDLPLRKHIFVTSQLVLFYLHVEVVSAVACRRMLICCRLLLFLDNHTLGKAYALCTLLCLTDRLLVMPP